MVRCVCIMIRRWSMRLVYTLQRDSSSATHFDGPVPHVPPRCSGVQGKEQGDEGYRGSQEDSGAQREFWGEFRVERPTQQLASVDC